MHTRLVMDNPCKRCGWREASPDKRFCDGCIEELDAQREQQGESFLRNLGRATNEVAQYQRGYADGWADANLARLKAENEDLREMLRVGNERMRH